MPRSLLIDHRDSSWLDGFAWENTSCPINAFSRLNAELIAPLKSSFAGFASDDNPLIFFLKNNDEILDWACWIPELSTDLTLGFSDSRLQYRCSKSNLQHELLLKAIKGRGSLQGLRVVDATGGLMRESAVLASAGCQVLAVERIALLAELLRQSALHNKLQGLDILQADSLDVFNHWAAMSSAINSATISSSTSESGMSESSKSRSSEDWTAPPDVIYLDPMYQQGMKPSAALKKEMVFLKTLNQSLGLAPDEAEQHKLLESARNLAVKKVVVKRAPKAAPIGGEKPASVVMGKALRFDIYPS